MWIGSWIGCAVGEPSRPPAGAEGRAGASAARSKQLAPGEWLAVRSAGWDWDVDGPPFEVVGPDGATFPSVSLSPIYLRLDLQGEDPGGTGDGSNGTEEFAVVHAEVGGTYDIVLFGDGDVTAVVGPAVSPWRVPDWFAPVNDYESTTDAWVGPATFTVAEPSVAWVLQPMGVEAGLAFEGPGGARFDLPTDESYGVFLSPGDWTLPSAPDQVTVIRTRRWKYDENEGIQNPRRDCRFDLGGLPGEPDLEVTVGPLDCLPLGRGPAHVSCIDEHNGGRVPGFAILDPNGAEVTTRLDPCEQYTLAFDAPDGFPWSCRLDLGPVPSTYGPEPDAAVCGQPEETGTPTAPDSGGGEPTACAGCASTPAGSTPWATAALLLALRRRPLRPR